VLSAYRTNAGRVWLITERGRSVTTLLVPGSIEPNPAQAQGDWLGNSLCARYA
jgi:hypothetical protein